MEECFESGWRAFDLAERLQTPVFVLSDLDLGMNLWMSEPFAYPDQPMDRGKVLSAEELNELRGFPAMGRGRRRHRLRARCPAPIIRSRRTSRVAAATTRRRSTPSVPTTGRRTCSGWQRKHDYARTLVPAPVLDETPGAEIGIIAYGSTDAPIAEARAHAGKSRRQDELSAAARPADHRRATRASSRSIRASTSSRTTSTGRWRRSS